jgi:hypothetical protein
MSNLKISYLLDKLMLDDDFSSVLEKSINAIMKDGKIDMYDIPEIVLIISELITKTPTITLTVENLTDLVSELITFITKKYNITIVDTETENFKRILNSSIKLLLFNPKVKKQLKACCSKFNVLCK